MRQSEAPSLSGPPLPDEGEGGADGQRVASSHPPRVLDVSARVSIENEIASHVKALRRYACLLAGDVADADDLVQECLVKVLAQTRAWRPVRDLRAYLFTTLHNTFIDSHRRKRVRANEVPVETVISDLVAPANQTAYLEFRDLVAAMRRIPAEQREVVILIGVEGMSYLEAAEILKLPIGTVMSRLSRGREALRRLTSHGATSRLRVVK